jgi:thymidylate synthase
MTTTYSSLNAVQVAVLKALLETGMPASPRGMPTRELLFFNFTLSNPRARLLTLRGRRWDLALAVGELCWHLSASNDADFIGYYASAWAKLAASGCTIPGSSYGKTIFSRHDAAGSQWDRVKSLLQADPNSRRAILFFNDAPDRLVPSVRDVACASSFQFLIRNGTLDAILTMRSNDAIMGLPYDIFFFSMIQEIMSVELGVELGRYFHGAGSMHLYERHFRLAERMIDGGTFDSSEMPAVTEVGSISSFLSFEKSLRLEQGMQPQPSFDSGYWDDLAVPLRWHRERKRGATAGDLRQLEQSRYGKLLGHASE